MKYKKTVLAALAALLCVVCLSAFYAQKADAAFVYDPDSNVYYIEKNADWKYLENGGALLDAMPAFDISAVNFDSWQRGNAPFGYGYELINTELDYGSDIDKKYNCSIFTKNFEVQAETLFEENLYVMADILYDDACVVYLNGTETDRKNIAFDAVPKGSVYASAAVNVAFEYERLMLDRTLLNEGTNTLTVIVFQNSPSGADFLFDMDLFVNSVPDYPLEFYPSMIAVTFCKDAATEKAFNWKTDKAFRGSDVEVTKKTSSTPDFSKAWKFGGTAQEINGEWIHKAVATNLAPDTTYYYRVGDKAANAWSEPAELHTSDNDGKFTFIHTSDVQSESYSAYNKWKNVLDTAFEIYPDIDFVANTGDFTENGTYLSQWEWMFSLPAETLRNTTLAPVTGNHDRWDNVFVSRFNTPYPEDIDETVNGVYYSFDYENAHFTVLNTNDTTKGVGLNDKQYEWFKNDVSSADKQWKIVMLHAGLYTSGNKVNVDTYIADMRKQIVPFMLEQGVDIVLQGHDHVYIRTKPQLYGAAEVPDTITETYNGNTVTYMASPKGIIYINSNSAGGATLYSPIDYDKTEIFPELTAQPQTTMFSAIRIDGNRLFFDSYTVWQPENGIGKAEYKRYDGFAIKKDLYLSVIKDIASLPVAEKIKGEDYEKIMSVKAAYNRLEESERIKITNLETLTLAERRVKEILREKSYGGKTNLPLIIALFVGISVFAALSCVTAIIIIRRKRHAK